MSDGQESARGAVDARASGNMAVAKAAAILSVVLGHFGLGIDVFWNVTSVGLFIFGFSSGYFTSARYHGTCRPLTYWRRKGVRLGVPLLGANAFLLVLFLVKGTPGVWTWQTAVNMVGMTGLLNWFTPGNPSPFGVGLWFLTLLLIFYMLYPLIRLLTRSRAALWGLAGLGLAAYLLLQQYVPLSHALWLSAWSILFGILVHRTGLAIPVRLGAALAGLLACAMLLLNLALGVNQLNVYLLVALSVFTVLAVKDAALPKWLFGPGRFISSCLLQIYVLHFHL